LSRIFPQQTWVLHKSAYVQAVYHCVPHFTAVHKLLEGAPVTSMEM